MLTTQRRLRGATLLELIVTVSIVGILMAIGVPQLGDWVRRNSVGSAAEIIQNGLRQAEAEAIRRNQRVEFLLTNDTPSQDSIKTVTAAANGANWASRVLDADFAPLSDITLAYVNVFRMKDVSADVAIQGRPTWFSAATAGSSTSRARRSPNTRFSGSPVPARIARCACSSPRGGIRTCDPAITSGKPFACLPLVSAEKCPKP
jgi:type IV fimbrial biogenesis protein FimT